MRAVAIAAVSIVVLNACVAAPPPKQGSTQASVPVAPSRNAQIDEGIRALGAGEYDAAIRGFNRALSRAPDSAPAHLLAGMAYHLSAVNGNPGSIELAEVGYSVASQLTPSIQVAQLQLGRLHLDARSYGRAQAAFARVLDLEPDDAQAAFGLAIASYYAGDLETANGAIRAAANLRPGHSETLRAATLIYSASGLDGEARAVRDRLVSAGVAGEDLRYVDRRMSQWRQVHLDLPQAEVPVMLAQATLQIPLAQAAAAVSPGAVMAPHWADCAPGFAAGGSAASSTSVPVGIGVDETSALAALPSPCTGRPLPRMLQVDATFITTEEFLDTSKGVNLLQGLQVVLGASRTWVSTLTTGGSPTQTITTNRSLGMPSAGVAYSLNIANAADLRSDLLARPTLLALDRMPATFFAGTNISVAIAANLGGGNLVEKPIGMSLSVTPTFIDDETFLLAVKVSRSDVELGQPGSFAQSLHTTRNVVNSTAILKFDQTLILSGLIERESVFSKAGIPGLRDVPVVQYLSSTSTTQEAQKSMLVTITPRRVALARGGDAPAAAAVPGDPILAEVRQRLRKDFSLSNNSLAAMRTLGGNRYIAQFRAGDMKDDDWKAPESLEAMFRSVRRFLYY